MYLNSHGAGGFDVLPVGLTAVFYPAVPQFTISSPLNSPSEHCARLRAMRSCSETGDQTSIESIQDLSSLVKILEVL